MTHIQTAGGNRLELPLEDGPVRRHFSDPASHTDTILRQINDEKIYEPVFRGRRDLIFVDIGANVGLVSLYAQDVCRFILAVEPSPHFSLLEKLCGHYPHILFIQVAMAPRNEPVTLRLCDGNTTGHSLIHKFPGSDLAVPGETLKTILENYVLFPRVDLVKVDVEGAEYDCLTEMEIGACRTRVQSYFVETHEPDPSRRVSDRDRMIARFTRCGYHATPLADDRFIASL